MAAYSQWGFDLTPPSPEQRKLLEADLTTDGADVLLRRGTEAPFCGLFLNEKRINSVSLDFTPKGEPLPDKLGRGAPEGERWQGR